jgi:hypothetical protein
MVAFGMTPRGKMARDDADENYPPAHEHFPGGIQSLVKWARKNLRARDIETLIKELEGELSHRMTTQITGDSNHRSMTPERKRVEKSFANMFGPAVRVLPVEPTEAAPSRPVHPERMRRAGETLAAILGDMQPNKVLK